MSVIPKGSKVLVTGVSGYIGSNVADQLVAQGFTVRGTSRSKSSAQWIVDFIDKKYGKGKIEIYEVTDMTSETAYDGAIKGVSGAVHLATVGSATEGFDSDPKKVITPVIASTTNILSSAKKEPGIKAVVLTSSSTAAAIEIPDTEMTLTEDSWDQPAVDKAWNDPNVDGFTVYAASKTEGERHFWQRAKDEKLPFQVVTVLPAANFGPITKPNGENSSSTGSWINMIWNHQTDFLFSMPAGFFIHVVDSAKLHVIGLTDPEANGRRLFGYAQPYTWREIVDAIKEVRPNHELPSPPKQGKNLFKIEPAAFAESLLKKRYGHGFQSLHSAVKEAIASMDKQ